MMEKCNYRKDPHQDIDHVFRDLLPAHGMVERPAQVELSHQMLDTMLNGSIALCDAGTGIGKTYAYLVAGVVFRRYRSRAGLPNQPLLISTSSIALQGAIIHDYLPFLSKVMMADGMLDSPLRAVLRKGKSHYVCDAPDEAAPDREPGSEEPAGKSGTPLHERPFGPGHGPSSQRI